MREPPTPPAADGGQTTRDAAPLADEFVFANDIPPVGTSTVVRVGPSGGTVEVGGLRVEIGANALGVEQEVSVVVEDGALQDGGYAYSHVYRFGPEGLRFSAPVRISIPFSGMPSLAAVFWSKEEAPDEFELVESTFDGAYALVEVSHFSRGSVRNKCAFGSCGCTNDEDCTAYDNDLCDGQQYCQASTQTCVLNPSTVVTCDDSLDTTCQENHCVPSSGLCQMMAVNEGGSCQDADPFCTSGDSCQSGSCASGTNICDCQSDAECGGQEDGNLCNGTLYCDKSEVPFTCEINPATIVSCATDGDTACSKNVCNPSTGMCGMVDQSGSCDDGNACTSGDACQSGVCVGGPVTCECQFQADCATMEDGNLCNGTLYCDLQSGSCVLNPASVVTCPDVNDTACVRNRCQPMTGECAMTHEPGGTSCDDGDSCTSGDSCQDGICTAGTTTCQCQEDADCVPLEDGDLCNGTLYCNKQQGTCVLNPATVITCSTTNDTICLANTCQPSTGTCTMTAVNAGGACDDLNVCTTGDTCNAGQCQPGTNQCQCALDSDCSAFEDGDACNGTLYCDKAQVPALCSVNPATVVTCDPSEDTSCSVNTCNKATGICGMEAINEGGSCNDGDSCTSGDACTAGACQGVSSCTPCQSHDDCFSLNAAMNICYGYGCDFTTGVCTLQNAPDGSNCDLDGIYCTGDTCSAGTCQPGALFCTSCDSDADCVGQPVGECQVQHCDIDPEVGDGACYPQPVADGTPCDSDNNPTTSQSCVNGRCV